MATVVKLEPIEQRMWVPLVPVVEMADLKNLQGFCGGFDTAAHLEVT